MVVIGSLGGSFFLGALLKGGLKGGPPKKFQFFFYQKLLKHHIRKVKQLETMFPMLK